MNDGHETANRESPPRIGTVAFLGAIGIVSSLMAAGYGYDENQVIAFGVFGMGMLILSGANYAAEKYWIGARS